MSDFIQQLMTLVGRHNVITSERKTEFYRTGFRSGKGTAQAVVFPSTLLQQWRVLQACVAANKIVIMQAANTGLTEGSTPSGDNYDREIVVINTTRINTIITLDQGQQIISFCGATLHTLEQVLKPLNRSPHSVVGSSCIGASIVGGVANNSGGALVKRGPAYTELALFAQLNAKGELELVNHLGIDLGQSPEDILNNLDHQRFDSENIQCPTKAASDKDYTQRVRDIDADSPARYNADPERLHEASGCAGKLAVFAVRLDTFPMAAREQLFYIGTNDAKQLMQLRRDILSDFEHLPESAEYLHRDCFNLAEGYGKDSFLIIYYLGTNFMPKLFAFKGMVDATLNKLTWLPSYLLDRIMQGFSRLWPQHLPQRMLAFRDRYQHYLLLKMSDEGIVEAQTYLEGFFANTTDAGTGGYFTCDQTEAKKAYLHRFAAAGAAIRYQIVHSKTVGDVVSLDIALKRNEQSWQETLPAEIAEQIDTSLYYGHFLCHVFHQDYILRKGADHKAFKAAMLALLDRRGAKYPAEHNVGHLYQAEDDLADFYKTLDPTNSFNPGIGKSSKVKHQTI